VPVWRIRLPGERTAAGESLRAAERSQAIIGAALPNAQERLVAASSVGYLSFVAGAPEHDLREALANLPSSRPGPANAFPVREGVAGAWERAYGSFTSALDHLRHLVIGHSWVETSIDDVMVARTLLGRAGDRSTAWQAGASAEAVALHSGAVRLCLDSSAAFARSFGMALRGASLVTSLASGPAGILLALPAIWTFFDDVVSEVRHVRVGEGKDGLLP